MPLPQAQVLAADGQIVSIDSSKAGLAQLDIQ